MTNTSQVLQQLTNTPASSWVAAWGYVPSRRTVVIVTKTGRIYAYGEVDQSLADALGQAGSVGEFVNAHIKSHTCREIDQSELAELAALTGRAIKAVERKRTSSEVSSALLARYPFLRAAF
jgi:hypothetical protein